MLVPLVLRDKQLAGTILDEMEDPEENTNTAVASAVATFVAFVFFGLIPLISIICLPLFGSEFVTSCFWTGITLMLLGYFKVRTQYDRFKNSVIKLTLGCLLGLQQARVTKQKTHVSSLMMLCLGGGVSLLAYGIARCMAPFVDLGNATVSETIAAK
jgi:VIT1/CCC1 family predicted Fe2+/Mn2+ transporter